MGCLYFMFVLCFARFGRISAHQFWFRGHALIWRLSFYTLWEDTRITKLIPWEFLHLTFLLCPTCFEMTSAQQFRFPGSVCIWRSSYVLHGLRGLQDNKCDSLGVPAFDTSLEFYTLWEDISTTHLISLECPYLTFLLCFARLDKTSVQTNWFPRSAWI